MQPAAFTRCKHDRPRVCALLHRKSISVCDCTSLRDAAIAASDIAFMTEFGCTRVR
jgi:hypothetical protein